MLHHEPWQKLVKHKALIIKLLLLCVEMLDLGIHNAFVILWNQSDHKVKQNDQKINLIHKPEDVYQCYDGFVKCCGVVAWFSPEQNWRWLDVTDAILEGVEDEAEYEACFAIIFSSLQIRTENVWFQSKEENPNKENHQEWDHSFHHCHYQSSLQT